MFTTMMTTRLCGDLIPCYVHIGTCSNRPII